MQLFINNWQSELTAGLAASAQSASIDPGAAARLVGLGGGDHYLLTLIGMDSAGSEVAWEIVRVTATVGGVLTLQRAQEGTSAADWPAGTRLELRVTAGAMAEMAAAAAGAVQASDLADVATSGAYGDLTGKPVIPSTPGEVGAATAAQGAKADTAVQPGSLAPVATSGAYGDLTGKPFIPSAAGDIGAATTEQGALAETAVQPASLTSALASKVDVQAGYGLSQENFTSAEKAKLAGLESSSYKGTYVNLAALQAAHPTADPGAYADVDAGVSDPVLRYIWDASDSQWVAQAGSADPVTAAQVKTLYESNPDTNAFTDAEQEKLGGVATGATANPDTDSLPEGATNQYHTAARVRGTLLTGFSLADSVAVAATDTVLQAIGKLAARLALAFDRANHTGEQAISTVTGLQAALDKALFAPVVTDATTARTSLLSDAGSYLRFTAIAAKAYTVQPQASVAWAADSEIHGRNAATSNLTLTPGSGVTLNAPYGGTLLIPTGGSFTLKRVATDVWDVIGQTVAA